MSQSMPEGPDNADNVYYLDDYRPDPHDDDRAIRHHRLTRRRVIASAVLAGIALTGVAVAKANTNSAPLPVYCGYALVDKGQGGISIADEAARSQRLPTPGNGAEAGKLINGMGPHENARYIMWIASNGNTTAHILPETIQEWSGNSNPCPTGPLPAPVRLGETPTPTPLQS